MRLRSSYSKSFKTQVVQECLQPGVSIASVALRHGINANLVRKWIPVYRDHQVPALAQETCSLRSRQKCFWSKAGKLGRSLICN
ncbi:transposase [Pseudomonas sp. GG8]